MLQLWTKALASHCCNNLPADLVACALREAMKSPVHANAAGLSHVGQPGGSNRASDHRVWSITTDRARNGAVAETDFGKTLLGRYPMGLPALLTSRKRPTADVQSGNETDKDHRYLRKFTVCCGAI